MPKERWPFHQGQPSGSVLSMFFFDFDTAICGSAHCQSGAAKNSFHSKPQAGLLGLYLVALLHLPCGALGSSFLVLSDEQRFLFFIQEPKGEGNWHGGRVAYSWDRVASRSLA